MRILSFFLDLCGVSIAISRFFLLWSVGVEGSAYIKRLLVYDTKKDRDMNYFFDRVYALLRDYTTVHEVSL